MNLILFDDACRDNLLPFVFIRPACDIRIGILTVREKWEKCLSLASSSITRDYLSKRYPAKILSDNLLINGRACPTTELVREIHQLTPGYKLIHKDNIVALRLSEKDTQDIASGVATPENVKAKQKKCKSDVRFIQHLCDIFKMNDAELRSDYKLLTRGRKSAFASNTNEVLGHDLFIEKGAVIECSTINTKTGPVYIGKGAEVMEGCLIRGPFALGENAVLKMGAKIYGATTIGPHSKAGGEVNNSVIFGYSNKAHDGFLGNSVIGEWCNIGADSNNSNLKNNYGEVKIWSYTENKYVGTGLQFCGIFMGDHSKCGINTMFNTGTVIGISANIFGGDFPPKFIPSFSWGGSSGFEKFAIDKAIDVAATVMKRRGMKMGNEDKEVFRKVFEF